MIGDATHLLTNWKASTAPTIVVEELQAHRQPLLLLVAKPDHVQAKVPSEVHGLIPYLYQLTTISPRH
jgi:hypothetical protein